MCGKSNRVDSSLGLRCTYRLALGECVVAHYSLFIMLCSTAIILNILKKDTSEFFGGDSPTDLDAGTREERSRETYGDFSIKDGCVIYHGF